MDDYVKTAEIMLRDAQTLAKNRFHRNACYLAGYVVECTVKTLLKIATQTSPQQIHDLESLHQDVVALSLTNNPLVVRYPDPTTMAPTMLQQVGAPRQSRGRTTYYCHWDPFHRYDGSRWDAQMTCDEYIKEAEQAVDTLLSMMIDGVL